MSKCCAIISRSPGIRRKLRAYFLANRPDLFIAIDAPDFNLGLELALKQQGIATIHYVSPSIWAWRGERIHKIKRAVSHMLALFPHEPEIYRQAGVPVDLCRASSCRHVAGAAQARRDARDDAHPAQGQGVRIASRQPPERSQVSCAHFHRNCQAGPAANPGRALPGPAGEPGDARDLRAGAV